MVYGPCGQWSGCMTSNSTCTALGREGREKKEGRKETTRDGKEGRERDMGERRVKQHVQVDLPG